MMDWLANTKLLKFLMALLSDGGPSSTRTVVLSVNATICLVELALCAAACTIALRHDAAQNIAVLGALLTAMSAIVAPLLGFAMNMQTTRYKLAAGSSATPTTGE